MGAPPESFSRQDPTGQDRSRIDGFRHTMRALRLLFAAFIAVSLLMVLLMAM